MMLTVYWNPKCCHRDVPIYIGLTLCARVGVTTLCTPVQWATLIYEISAGEALIYLVVIIVCSRREAVDAQI